MVLGGFREHPSLTLFPVAPSLPFRTDEKKEEGGVSGRRIRFVPITMLICLPELPDVHHVECMVKGGEKMPTTPVLGR